MQDVFTVTGGFFFFFFIRTWGTFSQHSFQMLVKARPYQHLPHGSVASPAEFACGPGWQQKTTMAPSSE